MASLLKHEKLSGALGILCFLLLSYPLLQIFNKNIFMAEIPLLFLYLFVVWLLAIIGLYGMTRRFGPPDDQPGKLESESHDQ